MSYRTVDVQGFRRLFRILLLVLAVVLSSAVKAGGGGGVGAAAGNATELTQLLNNAQLLGINASTAAQQAKQVQMWLLQIEQYQAQIQNLQRLSQGQIGNNLAAYVNMSSKLVSMQNNLTGLANASIAASNMLTSRVNEMQTMGMTPQQYLANESNLAATKGGIYQQQMQSDLQTIDNLAQRQASLQAIQSQIPGIQGNLDGLQTLNTQTNMATGELMDIKAAILAQNVIARQKNMEQEAANQASANNQSAAATITQSNQSRDGGISGGITSKPSWLYQPPGGN